MQPAFTLTLRRERRGHKEIVFPEFSKFCSRRKKKEKRVFSFENPSSSKKKSSFSKKSSCRSRQGVGGKELLREEERRVGRRVTMRAKSRMRAYFSGKNRVFVCAILLVELSRGLNGAIGAP